MEMNAPANIMVIGDDTHFCYMMRSYIRRSAHHSLFSSPGDGAVEVARRERPALIVLDVDLPGMGGWTLLRALHNDQCTSAIPVLVCSWLDERERCAQEGAFAYLRMPILYADFLDALKNIGITTDPKTAQ